MSGVLTDGGPSPLPLNPDGTPNLSPGAGAPVPVNGGAFSLYDVPQELTDYLASSPTGGPAGKLVFSIGHKTVSVPLKPGTDTPLSEGLIGGDIPLGPYVTDKSREAYNIYKSPVQVMKSIQALSYSDPLQFMAIQKALAQGAWGTVYLNGTFDPATEQALGVAMLQYAKLSIGTGTMPEFTYTDPESGKEKTVGGFMAYLLSTARTVQATGGDGSSIDQPGSGLQPAPIQVTDPTAIRDAAQTAAQSALGQGLSEDQLAAFVAQFQAAQTSFHTTNAGAISAPDLASEANKFAQDDNPTRFRRNQEQNYMNAFINMFAPSGSTAPGAEPAVADI